MNTFLKVSFYIYLLLVLFLLVTGVLYILTPTVMSYHHKAIAVPWNDIVPGIQTLLWLLVKVLGISFLIISIAILILLSIPYRRAEKWSIISVAVLAGGTALMTFFGSLYVHLKTGAATPWPLGVFSLALAIAAAGTSAAGIEKKDA